MSTYPEVEGDVIVPWGPGYDHGIGGADGLDALVIGHEIDMRPEGGTVASLEINIANGSDAEVLNMVGVELTVGDLMKLGNWAYDRAIAANGTDETAGSEVQYLQVAPVMYVDPRSDDGARLMPHQVDSGDSELMQCETTEDMRWVAMWTVYMRVFDPADGIVKAEALRDVGVTDPTVDTDESKEAAMRIASLLSAGRWPIEVIDPRG